MYISKDISKHLAAWLAIQGGSVFRPAYSLASVWLDGSILQDGNNYYFINKKSGNNVLITGYDFPTGWAKGFPYKSAATIDIGGYTGVPVVSLFQNMDYANIMFCKHSAQVVDSNGVEIYEPRVSEIVVYSEALTGANLTAANTYFNVPIEEATAQWIDVNATASTEAGTKANPYKSFVKANTSGTTGRTVYVKTGTYRENSGGNYFYCSKRMNYKSIGKSTMVANSIDFIISIIEGIYPNFDNMIFDSENRSDRNVYMAIVASTVILNRCLFKNAKTEFVYNENANASVQITNSVFVGALNATRTSQKITVASTNINTCLLTNTQIVTPGNNLVFSNNKVNTDKDSVITATNTGIVAVGNSMTFAKSGLIQSANYTISKTINLNHNRFNSTCSTTGKAVNFAGAGTVTFSCKYNYFANLVESAISASSFINVSGFVDIDGNNFISKTQSAYQHVQAYGTGAKIKNNHCSSNSLSGFIIALGIEGLSTGLNNNAIITGNRVIGSRFNLPALSATTHPIFVNSGINIKLAYNYISHCPLGIIVKTGTQLAYTSEGVYSNLFEDCVSSIYVRGVSGLNIFNNTIKHSATSYGQAFTTAIYCDENSANAGDQFSENIIIKNNIIDIELVVGSLIQFDAHAAANGCIAENNQLFGGQYLLSDGTNYSNIATAQAAGKLLNCVVGDPLLSAALITATPITGADLGADYNYGLDVTSTFGSETTTPNIILKEQAATWQNGAYVQ